MATAKNTKKSSGKTTNKSTTKSTTKKPATGAAKTNKPKTTTKKSNVNGKENQGTNTHYYEIKLITLVAFMVLSAFSLHSQAIGALGLLLRNIYLGLFGVVGYYMPYLLCVGIFFYINPNFAKHKMKNTVAVGILGLVGVLLNYVVQLSDKQIVGYADGIIKGMGNSFNIGVSGTGSGLIGTLIGTGIHKVIGTVGIYIVAAALALIFLVLTTSFKLSELINKASKSAKDFKVEAPTMPTKAKKNDNIILETELKSESVGGQEKKQVDKKYNEREFLKKLQNDDYLKSPTKSLVSWMNKRSENGIPDRKIEKYDFDKINHTKEKEKIASVEQKMKKKQLAAVGKNSVNKENEKEETENKVIVKKESVWTKESPGIEEAKGETAAIYNTEVLESGEELIIEPVIVSHVSKAQVEAEKNHENVSPSSIPALAGNIKDIGNEAFTYEDDIELDTGRQSTETSGEISPESSSEAKAESEKPLSKSDEKKIINEIDKNVRNEYEDYKIPKISLLSKVKNTSNAEDKKNMLERSKLLEDTLKVFGVEAKVIQISRGPAITRYEIQLKPGTKISKIVGLSDDIALNLATQQVRIAPVPGKAAVGIEIPNKDTQIVSIREVLESSEFKNGKSKLNVGLGKDIAGQSIIADIGKMPHTLVAGATGSGKSVCINTIIVSILCNTKPNEVKLLMVDPKMVELNNYNGIPHLILPVVTDPKKASVALNWAVQEMTKRYTQFAETGVRDIDGFNTKFGEDKEKFMPRIVVIIDELADLMMVAPNQVEDAICRLAQMARAAGIHLILATQRPSVDVITGIIKANIPSRIAFAVSSQTDSRTILDMGGAEKLLGKGDMLYYPVGASKPVRVQGAYISDKEVEDIVAFIKDQTDNVQYNEEILETTSVIGGTEENADEFLSDAISLVVDMEQASISMLQRKFRIGYNRAARLIDSMEERGIVGPSQGSKARAVLLTKEGLSELE